MGCKVEPKVTNSKGEKITAPLYNEVKKLVGPIKAKRVFDKLVSEELKTVEGYDKLEFDEYKMPTIESLLEHTDFIEYVDNLYYASALTKELLGEQSVKFSTPDKAFLMFAKVLAFNQSNKYFDAFLVKNAANNNYELTVSKKSAQSYIYGQQMEQFARNVQNISNALSEAGFDNNYITNLINSNYNINYAKNLDTGSFNPDAIIDEVKNLADGKDLTPEKIASLVKNSMFKSDNKDRFYNYVSIISSANIEVNGTKVSFEHFKYQYLRENNLIGDDVTEEDVSKEKSYNEIIANHILSRALADSFSLKDAKYNETLLKRVDLLAKEINDKLRKIDKSQLLHSNGDNTGYNESKRDIDLSLKSLFSTIEKEELENKDKYQTAASLLSKLISAENSRLMLAVRSGNKKQVSYIKERIKKLTDMYEGGEMNLAFISFLKEQSAEIKAMHKSMQESMSDDALNVKSKKVRDLIQLCDYYNNCIEYFNAYMSTYSDYAVELKNELSDILDAYKKQGVSEADFETLDAFKAKLDNATTEDKKKLNLIQNYSILVQNYIDVVKNPILENEQLSKFTQLINTVREEAQTNALNLTAEFLQKFQTEEAQHIPWGKRKGETLDIKKELQKMRNDINFYDLYLDAMADCPDMIMRLTDKAIKTTKNVTRLAVLELSRQIKKEAALLKKSGVNDFSWMYKRNEFGKKTGKYIIESDVEFANILNSPSKLRFYKFFMETKKRIDNYYPNNNGTAKIIAIRKDRLERLKNSNSIKDFGNQIFEGIKDNYLDREDDDDIAGYEQMFVDISGNEIKLLPTYYNNVNEGNADHMSEDAVSTLIAYANKGIEYHNMVDLVNSIELEREVLKLREMPVMSGGKKGLNMIKRKLFTENPELISENEITQQDLGRSNVYKFFDSQIDSKLYGKSRNKGKHIGKLSIDKVIDQLNKKTAVSALSLNLLNGISNVMTGTSMTRIEAVCQQYFSVKDLAWADATYTKEMPSYLSEKGNNVKESKLHLFIELFDVLQEFDKDVNETDWMKDTWFKKMVNSEFMSVVQNAGEHYMHTRIALALAHSMKLKTKSGKETNLWEMLDVEYLQEDGTYGKTDKKLGAKLVLKEECVDKDGNSFTLNDINIQKVTRKMASINQGVHGIYNKQDANLIQKTAVCRLIYMFRKWIPKSLDKRFANLKYNYDIEDWTEGYYQTLFNFAYGLIKERNGMSLEIAIRWKNLDKRQRANCIRALAESGQFLVVLLANNFLLDWKDDDDKSEYTWATNMFYYQMIRLQSELAALTPISFIGYTVGSKDNMLTEFVRLFKNPIAAVAPVSDALKLGQLLYPSTWTEEVKRGPYKGYSKAFVTFFGNKFLFPIGAMIPKNSSPEDYVGYYLM